MKERIEEYLIELAHGNMMVDYVLEKIMQIIERNVELECENQRSWSNFKPGDMK